LLLLCTVFVLLPFLLIAVHRAVSPFVFVTCAVAGSCLVSGCRFRFLHLFWFVLPRSFSTAFCACVITCSPAAVFAPAFSFTSSLFWFMLLYFFLRLHHVWRAISPVPSVFCGFRTFYLFHATPAVHSPSCTRLVSVYSFHPFLQRFAAPLLLPAAFCVPPFRHLQDFLFGGFMFPPGFVCAALSLLYAWFGLPFLRALFLPFPSLTHLLLFVCCLSVGSPCLSTAVRWFAVPTPVFLWFILRSCMLLVSVRWFYLRLAPCICILYDNWFSAYAAVLFAPLRCVRAGCYRTWFPSAC
jgi:hypothetical protein